MTTETHTPPSQVNDSRAARPSQFEVFYDGGCPFCRREIGMLRRLDRRRLIQFTDLAAPAFDAARLGRTHVEMMGEIHGRLPDGTWIKGVEVFRQLYGTVGFRWLVSLSRWPGVRQVLDVGYRVFARNRLRVTGRCSDRCRIR